MPEKQDSTLSSTSYSRAQAAFSSLCVLGKGSRKMCGFGITTEASKVSEISLEIIIMANTRQGDDVEEFIFGFSPNSPEKVLVHFSPLSRSLRLAQDSLSWLLTASGQQLLSSFSLPWKLSPMCIRLC